MQSYFTERNFKLLDEMEAIGNEHGKSMAQVALGWTLTNPLITAPIVGARDVAQLQESIDAVGFRLSAEEMGRLDELTSWS